MEPHEAAATLALSALHWKRLAEQMEQWRDAALVANGELAQIWVADQERIAALLARLQAAEAVCAALEPGDHDGPACQECGECAECGHEPDCSIGVAMAAYREATVTPGGERGRT